MVQTRLADLTVDLLRSMFRNMSAFRAAFETDGLDSIRDHDGNEWSLWDLEYLLDITDAVLTPRQSQSIHLFLVANLREVDVARMMGVSETNPVGMYATAGLERLIELANEGRLNRYRLDKRAG